MNRMDICAPRKGNDGKTRWLKIGAAFPAKSGNGWNLIFDALPLPDAEGRCAVSLFEPKPRDGQQGQQQGQSGGYDPRDMGDEIPF